MDNWYMTDDQIAESSDLYLDLRDSYKLAEQRIYDLEQFLKTKVLHFVEYMAGETGDSYRWQQSLLKEIQEILEF